MFNDLQYVDRSRVSVDQVLQDKDILICMANGSKDLVGKAAVFADKSAIPYTFGAFMACLRLNQSAAHPGFVALHFETWRYRCHIANLLAGSSINNLAPSAIEGMTFDFPDIGEQTAIAAILSDIDAELTALAARRDKTRALKRGMMQALLTGRIRLV